MVAAPMQFGTFSSREEGLNFLNFQVSLYRLSFAWRSVS
jgi:hypothetical protein